MYSFCITLPYSGVLAVGGLVGYVKVRGQWGARVSASTCQ